MKQSVILKLKIGLDIRDDNHHLGWFACPKRIKEKHLTESAKLTIS